MTTDIDPPSEPGSAAPDDATRIGAAAPRARTAAPAPDIPFSTRLQPGQLLSHTFEIEVHLAEGGMGEVYRARHVELGSTHAIKVIRPELANDPRIVSMFTEEARKLKQVRADAVVGYDGMFREADGRRYLVMEYVDGISLAQAMRARKFTSAELLVLRDRLAQGLAAAHDKLIYHRDISPDNIILVDNRVELAKIIDFGIAKAAGAGEPTVVGSDFAGKYSYVSPEQLGMFGGEIDARSDIYSLGLVLAAASLGHALPMGNSPVSAVDARRGVPDLSVLPADLRDELAPMLVPDPGGRPRSMRELAGRGAGGGPSTRTPQPLADRREAGAPGNPIAEQPSKRRSRVPLLAAIALACAIVGGSAAYVFLPGKTPHAVTDRTPPRNPEPAATPGTAPVAALPPPLPVPSPPPAAAPVPESPPAPVPDRAEIAARVARATQGFACADLRTTLSQDLDLQVTGFISSGTDETSLRRALGAIPNLRRVALAVPVYVWPHCEMIKLLQASGSLAAGVSPPRLDLNIPSLTYLAGDKLIVRAAQSTAFDGYLYVDYFDNAGSVVHLFPRPNGAGRTKAGQIVTLGTDSPTAGKDDPVYEISEPFGPNLIVAISSPRRLMEARPAEVEDAHAYLPVLRRSLEADAKTSGAAHAASAYTFVTTAPR